MEKKRKVKKLQLSRETLQPLTGPDTGKVVGGIEELCSCGMSPHCPTVSEYEC